MIGLVRLARLKEDGKRQNIFNEVGIKLIDDTISSSAIDCVKSGVTDNEIQNILNGKLPEELRETEEGKHYIRFFEKGEKTVIVPETDE